jgi:carbon storage regulator
MLVLSRKREQTIMIGDDIEIKVVEIRGDKVKLGITAPKNVSVHRREVYDRIQRAHRDGMQNDEREALKEAKAKYEE